MEPVAVAVDAMGGDHAPAVVVKGVMDFLDNGGDTLVHLVGKRREIHREIRRLKATERISGLRVVNARDHISMREQLLSYWRKRESTSIQKALDLVREGKAAAMVSAGNTGAVMALAKTNLGMIEGIGRPALATLIPTASGRTLIMDVGANVDSKPRHLVEFALMGKVYMQSVLGVENPRIALMSIGEEEGKGNELIKRTHAILKSMDINFVGNIEGRDAYLGKSDLIVTDGFTGNVTIKVAEGVVDVVMSMLKREIHTSLQSRLGLFLLKRSMKRLRRRLDYAETGGALLLGIKGVVVIGHGHSNAKAVNRAIELSVRMVRERVQERMAAEMLRMRSFLEELSYV